MTRNALHVTRPLMAIVGLLGGACADRESEQPGSSTHASTNDGRRRSAAVDTTWVDSGGTPKGSGAERDGEVVERSPIVSSCVTRIGQ